MRSLALKRAGGAENRREDKRIALPPGDAPVQQHRQQGISLSSQAQSSQHVSPSWASDFVQEVERHEALARQRGRQHEQGLAAMSAADELVISDSEEEEEPRALLPQPPPPSGDEEARRGLLKVAESMRRRVDEGCLQLLRGEQLRRQKEELVAKGGAVLGQHCAASWAPPQQQQQQQQQAAGDGASASVQVIGLAAECAAGQWWVQATVGLDAPAHAGARGASLLAASTCAELVCRQQGSVLLEARDGEPGAGHVRLQLTAALDLFCGQQQQQQQWCGHDGEGPWADVFLLLEQAAQPAALGRTEAGAPPVFLGRVQLAWDDWLRSHSALQPSAVQLPAEQQEQHTLVLRISSQLTNLACIRSVVQQQLGCVLEHRAAAAGDGAELFALRGAASPAATLTVALEDGRSAEVCIRAADARLASVLRQQMVAGLQQAARQAGAPPDDVTVSCSRRGLPPADDDAAADALVCELDAVIAWVEVQLQDKLALDSHMRQRKSAAPTARDITERRSAALAALAATDDRLMCLHVHV